MVKQRMAAKRLAYYRTYRYAAANSCPFDSDTGQWGERVTYIGAKAINTSYAYGPSNKKCSPPQRMLGRGSGKSLECPKIAAKGYAT